MSVDYAQFEYCLGVLIGIVRRMTVPCLSIAPVASPTPEVKWRRVSPQGRTIPSSAIFPQASANKEMIVTSVEFDDAGEYECYASNSERGAVVSHRFTIRVQCE